MHWLRQVDRFRQHLSSPNVKSEREPSLWAKSFGVWSLALCYDRSGVQGPSTAYDMQPYLLKIRGCGLRKAFVSIRCSSRQLLVQTGRCHVPQLQRKDRPVTSVS